MKAQIKHYRIKAGLTQCQLAERLGYKSGALVTMWESGERKPPSDKLPKLARALDCTIDDLFAADEPDDRPA